MTKQVRGKKSESTRHHHVAARQGTFEMVESYLPAGSPQRTVAGVGTAALVALLAAAVLGVGPAALAGAAGYLVYQETHR
jgi:hypothetical protein